MSKKVYNPHQLTVSDLSFGPSRLARLDAERGGCTWNNPLEKEIYTENLQTRGAEYAKSYLRENIKHWVAKREGREIPEWEVTLDDQGHLAAGGETLIGLSEAPITDKNSYLVADEIKQLVPIEVETVRLAEKKAQQGEKVIFMPEHSPSGIRFMTILRQDPKNPRRYIGSQQDLGANFSFDQAKIRMQAILSGQHFLRMTQSEQHEAVFVFGIRELTDSKQAEGARPVVHQRIKDFQGVVTNREDRQKAPLVTGLVAGVAKDVEQITRRVTLDVHGATVALGIAALEAVKRRKKKTRKRSYLRERIKSKASTPNIELFRNSHQRQKAKELNRNPQKTSPELIRSSTGFIRRKWQEMVGLKVAIAFTAQSGVGVGAGLLALRLMSRELPRSLRKINRERLSPRKNLRYKEAKGSEGKRRKEMRRKRKKLDKEEKITVKPERKKPEEKLRKRVKEVRGALVEKRWFRTERKPVSKRHENQLRRAAMLLARRFERVRRQVSERAKKKRKDIRVSEQIDPKATFLSSHEKQRKKEAVIGFSFAWVLWLLLLPRREKRARETLVTKQTEKAEQESLPTKEPTQWILLSIIWYLVMIREQGMKQQTHVKQTKKKKSVMQQFRYPTMPARGVIFALGS